LNLEGGDGLLARVVVCAILNEEVIERIGGRLLTYGKVHEGS
jgi:hypothetical protein